MQHSYANLRLPLYILITWNVWFLPSLLLTEYIPGQKGKANVYAASETCEPEMAEEVKKGIWEKNLDSKEQETLHFEFPLQVSKCPLWIS